jgi:hypothetical protein
VLFLIEILLGIGMLTKFIGLSIALLVGVLITINALYMLISPRAWFRLPSFLRFNGTLTEKKHAEGLGADKVRLLGAIFLTGIGWVLYDLFLTNR